MDRKQIVGASVILAVAVTIVCGGLFGIPVWNVWRAGLSGEANLRRAQQEKMILIEQAKAEVEAAGFRARAIGIVGAAAKEFPEYRLQEFMGAFAEALQNDSITKIIFVPTEANIPLIQAAQGN